MLEIVSAAGKLAKKYNLKKGEKILSFNGFEAVDFLDYAFFDNEQKFTMQVSGEKGVRTVLIEKEEGESLNLSVKAEDKIRTCQNHCVFCFVDQMPNGMRESLYIKDDDYTMSFMCGNFITMTNLTDSEMERIIRLKLSPLYISVHTLDGEKRKYLLGNRFAGKISEQLRKLSDGGITFHCQAVIVPGVNDGEDLEHTARGLFKLYPNAKDLAVVPTGLTKYREGLTQIPDITKPDAEKMLDLCEKLNKEFKVNFLLPADEYYIRAEREFEKAEFYGDFSQIENGIGMTSKFLSDFQESIYNTELKKEKRVAVITGVSAYPTIQKVCSLANKAVKNLHAFALPVENEFFGRSVTCTGLLTGGDILKELNKNLDSFDEVLLPANTLKEDEDIFLDGMKVFELAKKLKGKKLKINRRMEDFFENLIKR